MLIPVLVLALLFAAVAGFLGAFFEFAAIALIPLIILGAVLGILLGADLGRAMRRSD